ncbi:MAG: hypothetical protein IJ218_03875 [Alphaproteobacteria bacterium]|nr:hypothetical protein [Alphaproteobacteria bacterium]
MTDKWKQIAAGTVISITGVLGLTNCENKVENQEENKKPQTESLTENPAKHILKEIQVQGIPVEKKSTKANTPDSLLESVDIIIDEANPNKKHYEHPTYIAASLSASVKKIKDGTEIHYRARNFDSKKPEISSAIASYETGEYKTDTIITQSGDTLLQAGHNIKAKLNLKFAYGERTPDDSIREAKEKIEAQKKWKKLWNAEKRGKSDDEKWIIKERQDIHSSTVENGNHWSTPKPEEVIVERKGEEYKFHHEKSIYQEENEKVEFGYITGAKEASLKGDASTFEGIIQFANPDEEQVSAKQQKPEKKAPPKGSISKDAFINELLARSRSRNGKK